MQAKEVKWAGAEWEKGEGTSFTAFRKRSLALQGKGFGGELGSWGDCGVVKLGAGSEGAVGGSWGAGELGGGWEAGKLGAGRGVGDLGSWSEGNLRSWELGSWGAGQLGDLVAGAVSRRWGEASSLRVLAQP